MRLPTACGALMLLFASAQSSSGTEGQKVTKVRDQAALDRLLGRHGLSLQWVSWEKRGEVVVARTNGLVTIAGEQRDEETGNYVTVDGEVESIDSKSFVLAGTIVTRVDHIAGGAACTRRGRFTFRITGKRKYWRMKEMDSPCDDVTDYVDIYF